MEESSVESSKRRAKEAAEISATNSSTAPVKCAECQKDKDPGDLDGPPGQGICPECQRDQCYGCGGTFPRLDNVLDGNGLCPRCRDGGRDQERDNRTAGEKEADAQMQRELEEAVGVKQGREATDEQKQQMQDLRNKIGEEGMHQWRDMLAKDNDDAAYQDYLRDMAKGGGTGLEIDNVDKDGYSKNSRRDADVGAGMDWLDNETGGRGYGDQHTNQEHQNIGAGMNWLDNKTGGRQTQKQADAAAQAVAPTDETQPEEDPKKKDKNKDFDPEEKNFGDFLEWLFETGKFIRFRQTPGIFELMNMLNQAVTTMWDTAISPVVIGFDKFFFGIVGCMYPPYMDFNRSTVKFDVILKILFDPDDPAHWLSSMFRSAFEMISESPIFKQVGAQVMKVWLKLEKKREALTGGPIKHMKTTENGSFETKPNYKPRESTDRENMDRYFANNRRG